MATLYTAAIRRDAALTVFGRLPAALDTREATALDNSWTTGTPAGAAGYAEAEIFRFSNYLYAEGLDTAPNDWARWFVFEIALQLAPQWLPSGVADFQRLRDQFKQAALTTYSRLASDDDTSSDGQNTKSWLGIRRAVMAHCLHQPDPVFAQPELIDGAIRWSLYKIWNHAYWYWQIFHGSFTVTNAGGKSQSIVTGPNCRAVRSNTLWMATSSESNRRELKYIKPDVMSALLSRDLDDGRPEYYRLNKNGRSIRIQFERTPDATYTVHGEFVRRCIDAPEFGAMVPDTPTTQFDVAIGLMPDEFRDMIERFALARILESRGRREGVLMYQRAVNDLDELARSCDVGTPDEYDARTVARGAIKEQTFNFNDGLTFGGGL